MKLPLLFLLLVASTQCFYVYLRIDLGMKDTVKMTLNGNETLLVVSGTEGTQSPWISATDSVKFALENQPGLWVTMTPGPVGLPPLLQLSTIYTVGADWHEGSGAKQTLMNFKPRGIFPSYQCTQIPIHYGCTKMPPIGPSERGVTFSEVVLFTTDYEITYSL